MYQVGFCLYRRPYLVRPITLPRNIYYGGPYELIGPMVYTKSYIFNRFYQQCLVLLTMVPRNIINSIPGISFRSFVTTELVSASFWDGRIGTDTGCAGCRRVHRKNGSM